MWSAPLGFTPRRGPNLGRQQSALVAEGGGLRRARALHIAVQGMKRRLPLLCVFYNTSEPFICSFTVW